jgi:hypothetical protein
MARTNGSSAAIAAIAYAVKADEGLTFLRCWQHGEFDEIRADWPDAALKRCSSAPRRRRRLLAGRFAQERSAFAEQVIAILEVVHQPGTNAGRRT